MDRADVNDNEFYSLTDAALLTAHLFCSPMPPIPAPFPVAGQDPSDDGGGFGVANDLYEVRFSLGEVTLTDAEVIVTVGVMVSSVERAGPARVPGYAAELPRPP